MIANKERNKRQFYKHLTIILFIGGAFIFALLVAFERAQDIDAVGQMAEETITFLKGTCQRYDNYHIGVDTDARENLLDKSKILREYMTEDFLEDGKALLKFAKMQNLTGIYIVDDNLNTIAQTDIRGIRPEKIWKEQLRKESKKNIMTNSTETFSDKVKIGDTLYYVAMVSRRNANGMILCYRIADELSTDQYNSSFADLMKNNTFHKNPRILITDGNDILSTNAESLKDARSFKDIPNLDVAWSEHKLTKINYDGKTLYGMRQVYKQYYIYVCYESSEVFSNLIPVITVGIAIYAFCLMSMVLIRQNMRERNIIEQARQIQTIKAISNLYVSIGLLDLDTDECIPIQYSERLARTLDFETNGEKILELLEDFFVAKKYKEGFKDFIKSENIAAQLKQKKEFISYIYQDLRGAWYITYIIPAQFDEKDDIRTVLIATRDISEHQQKEIAYQDELKKTAEDAKLANAAKTTFLRRMSHDIRTPINGIRGMATLAKHHLGEQEKEIGYIDKIITSSDYLLDLVNDILQMNKLESGKIYFENKSFDIRMLLKETIEICRLHAEEQDIKLSLKRFKTDHAHLMGSPLHLKQIVQNLITNAIRYNRAGGRVDITLEEIGFDGEKAIYEFVCADTGIGMSEEFQKHLYEPFAQENDNGGSSYSGTGLGLPIVKQLIEHMGGSIEFTSMKGKGTTFLVKIALRVDNNYKRQEQEDTKIEKISIDGINILLVEDNEINMQIARELLEAKGAVITEAHDGKEAVQIFEISREGTFDVILMDIMMPEMDGLDATRYIRGLKRSDAMSIPIFAMTANAFIEDINQSREAGMNEHFSKPLNMDEVIKMIWQYTK